LDEKFIKHFLNWSKNLNENLEFTSTSLLLEENYFQDFIYKVKDKLNASERKFLNLMKNSFSGYFEIIQTKKEENKIKIRNLKNNDVFEVITEKDCSKYDIIMARIFEYKGDYYIFEDISYLLPRSYLYYIDINDRFINNEIKLLKLRNEVGIKSWDGFYRKRYMVSGHTTSYRKFIHILENSKCFVKDESEEFEDYYHIVLNKTIAKNIKRMPILFEEKPIVEYIIGFVWITDLRIYIIIGGFSVNFIWAILELFKEIYKIENTELVFFYEDRNFLIEYDFWYDFKQQYKENEIYEFYYSKKNYTDEEFKFYYNTELRFKKIGALNFFNLFEGKDV